eukprot:gene16724-22991_t
MSHYTPVIPEEVAPDSLATEEVPDSLASDGAPPGSPSSDLCSPIVHRHPRLSPVSTRKTSLESMHSKLSFDINPSRMSLDTGMSAGARGPPPGTFKADKVRKALEGYRNACAVYNQPAHHHSASSGSMARTSTTSSAHSGALSMLTSDSSASKIPVSRASYSIQTTQTELFGSIPDLLNSLATATERGSQGSQGRFTHAGMSRQSSKSSQAMSTTSQWMARTMYCRNISRMSGDAAFRTQSSFGLSGLPGLSRQVTSNHLNHSSHRSSLRSSWSKQGGKSDSNHVSGTLPNTESGPSHRSSSGRQGDKSDSTRQSQTNSTHQSGTLPRTAEMLDSEPLQEDVLHPPWYTGSQPGMQPWRTFIVQEYCDMGECLGVM